MTQLYKAAIDIGGTKITASLISRQGILIKVYQKVKLQGYNTTIPKQIDKLIGYLCQQKNLKKQQIDAIGISTCSPFKKNQDQILITSPNLCRGMSTGRDAVNDWTEIPITGELLKTYKHMEIGNDCVTAVVAERLFGAGQGEDDLVYMTWSTGIGSGAYVDGHLIKGKNGNAPHIGHIYIAEDGPQCGCGNYGDLESLTSGVSIARDYGATTEEVFNAYRNGEEKAQAIINRAARNFTRGMASINAILDPRVFVIGGSVFMNNQDILLPLISQEFYCSFPALSAGVEIRPSLLDKYLGDIAALSLVMPCEWIAEWQENKYWEVAPQAIIL